MPFRTRLLWIILGDILRTVPITHSRLTSTYGLPLRPRGESCGGADYFSVGRSRSYPSVVGL